MFSSTAWAQTAAPGATPGMIEQFLPFVFIIIIFYFLLIRPQQKRAKTHREFVTNLKRGDQVLTSGGIFGTIEGLTEEYVTLQIADGVKIRILKAQIASPVTKNEDKK